MEKAEGTIHFIPLDGKRYFSLVAVEEIYRKKNLFMNKQTLSGRYYNLFYKGESIKSIKLSSSNQNFGTEGRRFVREDEFDKILLSSIPKKFEEAIKDYSLVPIPAEKIDLIQEED